MNPRHRRTLLTTTAVLLLVLAGCASGPGATSTPDASTAMSPTPTATSASPAARPFDGDCGLIHGTASDGGTTFMTRDRGDWTPAIETAGGMVCAGAGGTLVLVPLGGVDEAFRASFAEPTCAVDYDTMHCRAADEAAGTWILFDELGAGYSDVEPDPRSAIAVVEAVAAQLEEQPPADADPVPAAAGLDCARVRAAADVDGILAPGPVHEGLIREGQPVLTLRVAEALGVVDRCAWSELEQFGEFAVTVERGGAQDWEERVAAAEAAPFVAADGVRAAIPSPGVLDATTALAAVGPDIVRLHAPTLPAEQLPATLAAVAAVVRG